MSATSETEQNGRPVYPCAALPAEGPKVRLLGLYNQRQEGLLMQRLKITGGRLTLAQWRRAAEVALRFTPAQPLSVTTRQDIELHGLAPENVPALQRALADSGVSTVGACGDSVRAVTVDPLSGLIPGSYDVAALAAAIHAHGQSIPGAFALPRKFKTAVSGSPDAAARPFINDLGLVANGDGTFRAVVAGNLGVKPSLGVVAYERLALSEVLPLVSALIRLFAAEGDRQNRSRARLRYVRERLGEDAFRQQLDALFQEEKSKPHPAAPAPVRYDGPARPIVRLGLPNGCLEPQAALALIEVAERRGAELRIGFDHDLFTAGLELAELPDSLRPLAAAPRVIACPGATSCQKAVTETAGAAAQLREAIPADSGLLAAVSGCPNGCSHAGVADIGLIGRLKTVGGVQRTHYRFLCGGGYGVTTALAVELHPALPLERVGAAAYWLASQWRADSGASGASFAAFVARERERLAAGLGELAAQ